MTFDFFNKRKKDILSKRDKSHKGNWDKKILNLCEKINFLSDYYTTSSCSGRIVLMIDKDRKEPGLFLKVYHDLISFEELKRDLEEVLENFTSLSRHHTQRLPARSHSQIDGEFDEKSSKSQSNDKKRGDKINKDNLNIKFKMEACALHVACKSLEDAKKLYDKAKLAGWKKSGIIGIGKRFMIELNSTEKIEFPIIRKGEMIVNNEFLRIIIEDSNKKLKKCWEKIGKLQNIIESYPKK